MGWVGDRSEEADKEEDAGEPGRDFEPFKPDLISEINAAGVEVIRRRPRPWEEDARRTLLHKLQRHLGTLAEEAEPAPAGVAQEPDATPSNERPAAPAEGSASSRDHDSAPGGNEQVALRGELYQPKARGEYLPYSRPTPELKLAREEALPQDGETYQLLNASIGECHFLMREVTFRSLCRATELEDRMAWLNASVKLAETGAKVGDSVARLMNGPEIRHTQHTQMIQHGYMEVMNPEAGGRKSSAKKAGKGGGRGSASP